MPDEIFWRQNLDHHRQLFIPSRRRFVFFLRLRIVLRRLRDGGAWQDDEWRRLMNGRPMGERFFLDRKISQSEARNFLPVKYANFVRCAFCVFRSHSFVSLSGSLSPTPVFCSPLFIGLTKAFGCQGVPFGYPPRHIPISLRYVVSGPRARSDWFAGATR